MTVSFDFDGTLDRPEVQEYAKLLIERGLVVLVCTYRCGGALINNDDLYAVTDEVGIQRSNIIFTCMREKSEFFAGRNCVAS